MSLLAPHPRRTAVLVEHSSPPRLPTVRLDDEEPTLPEILAAAGHVVAPSATVLRQVVTSPRQAQDELLLELEAVATDPPSGWTWLDLDGDAIARLEPETSRAAVTSWARERDEGWAPSRPAYSRPGWFAEASAWMVDRMAAYGHPALAPPHQHHLWDVSVVLRASSAEGDLYLKCSNDRFRHEAVVTLALAERMPGLAPDVVAVDADRGWLLMHDLGAPELGEQDHALWPAGIAAHASIQRTWLDRTDELVGLGLSVRSLADLAADVGRMTRDVGLLARMAPELRTAWLATASDLVTACRRLDLLGPGPTLVHGDLHPWNVTSGPDGTRVFDWTDAAVSHPCVDLATYVFRTEDVAVRRQLVDAYVDAWSGVAPEETLREAAALGLVVGALYQVQTYRSLLPALPRDGADAGLTGADVDWVDRSVTRYRLGLDAPR
ncbi:hypothetical protein EKO23_09800 [Nocardioides guangzhouensis]|uniref:Aminoglycoside phosphotransferase domain-containing protein n=1 Tax=Nocardioides guangzhouensis TaxID=2497878 RepID=A0A4V1XZC2_9ACTN|nr:phosphotransferase [Nocardioides guangzhouensis]RYP86239.1 hypothetical protein EKO23_09800 [Nocardioides guangzhouensis]